MFEPDKDYINQISIDCVIFGYKKKQLKVLVPKLNLEGSHWTLPGGFIAQEEDIDDAAQRILFQRTGISDLFLEQYRVFGQVPRNNKILLKSLMEEQKEWVSQWDQSGNLTDWLSGRFISIGYYALVDIDKVIPQCTVVDESIDWYDIHDLPPMIMDHNQQVGKALEVLRLHLDMKLLGFNLLPEKFTMKDLQHLYEAVYDKPFRRSNFQKKMLELGVLERLEKKFTGAANKAPYLYRFREGENA